MPPRVMLNQRGQKLGPKGRKTRERILDVTRELIAIKPFREVTAADISSAMETNPATFYIYFDDVDAVVEALLSEIAETTPDFTRYFQRPWAGVAAMQEAGAFIDSYLDYILAHYSLIKVRNHLADDGDVRFADIRARETADVVKTLGRQIATGGHPDRTAPAAALRDAVASAGLLMGMAGRLCTVCTMLDQHPYKDRGLTRARLSAAAARLLAAAVHDGSRADV